MPSSSVSSSSSSSPSPLRVGILGAAGIARKNADAIMAYPQVTNCDIVAIASRTYEKAKAFVQAIDPTNTKNITIFGGASAYDDLLNTDLTLIDAVFALRMGDQSIRIEKHVMIEKPVALSALQYEEMIRKAYEVNRFLMDGTMCVHNQRTNDLLQRCIIMSNPSKNGKNNDKRIGTVQRIEAAFTFAANADFLENNIRCKPDCDSLGAVGDLAWYCTRMGHLVYRTQAGVNPTAAKVVDCTVNEYDIPIDVTCIVYFEKDRKLVLHCSFTTLSRQHMAIIGENKTIRLDDFVVPVVPPPNAYMVESLVRTIEPSGKRFVTRDYETVSVSNTIDDSDANEPPQQTLLWRTFSRIVHDFSTNDPSSSSSSAEEWTTNTPSISHEAKELLEISLWNQKVVDAIMESIKLKGRLVEIQ